MLEVSPVRIRIFIVNFGTAASEVSRFFGSGCLPGRHTPKDGDDNTASGSVTQIGITHKLLSGPKQLL